MIGVVVPSSKCTEMKIISALTFLLVCRSLMSIWLADVNGRVVKAIVEKDFKMFL